MSESFNDDYDRGKEKAESQLGGNDVCENNHSDVLSARRALKVAHDSMVDSLSSTKKPETKEAILSKAKADAAYRIRTQCLEDLTDNEKAFLDENLPKLLEAMLGNDVELGFAETAESEEFKDDGKKQPGKEVRKKYFEGEQNTKDFLKYQAASYIDEAGNLSPQGAVVLARHINYRPSGKSVANLPYNRALRLRRQFGLPVDLRQEVGEEQFTQAIKSILD